MELKSMALSKTESKKMSEVSPAESDGPRYPYGLTLHLSNETIEKLGLAGLPDVGAKLMLEATVAVASASEHQRQGGEKHRSLELQITEMAVTPKADTDVAGMLFGSK